LSAHLEEVKGWVPNYTIKSFFNKQVCYQFYCSFELISIWTYFLYELCIVGWKIYSRQNFDMRISFSELIVKILVEIVFVLENRMRIFVKLQLIPARTDIVDFLAIFQHVGFATCTPWSCKDEFLYFRMVMTILDLKIWKQNLNIFFL